VDIGKSEDERTKHEYNGYCDIIGYFLCGVYGACGGKMNMTLP
jgi:hypothetical protein